MLSSNASDENFEVVFPN